MLYRWCLVLVRLKKKCTQSSLNDAGDVMVSVQIFYTFGGMD